MKRYVLGNKKGEYLAFKKGRSPEIVNKSDATTFLNRTAAENRFSAIPKKLGRDWQIILFGNSEIIDGTYEPIELDKLCMEIDGHLNLIEKMVRNKSQLEAGLSVLDSMEVDLKHLIEFNQFNAADGYKIYKVYHELRVKRREIKNQLEDIKYLETVKVTDLLNGGLKRKVISNEKKYNVRTNIAKPLFKESHLAKDIVDKTCDDIRSII